MPSHRLTQMQQQFLFVPGQISGERQRVGGMVGAEDDRQRRVEAADQFNIARSSDTFYYLTLLIILTIDGRIEMGDDSV